MNSAAAVYGKQFLNNTINGLEYLTANGCNNINGTSATTLEASLNSWITSLILWRTIKIIQVKNIATTADNVIAKT